MKRFLLLASIVVLTLVVVGCEPTSDDIQRSQQERILMEATSQVGMPAIKNFREKKLLKDILEMRDQTGLVTYAYLFSDYNGKFVYLGETVGYPMPYATQFTNPQKTERIASGHYTTLPQADPNTLFSPASAEGTWILMKDPNGEKVTPAYIEQRVQVFQFKLPASMCLNN